MNCPHCNSPVPENSKFCLECGADMSDPGGGPRTAERPEELTTRLTQTLEGRYRIGKMVGRGGMGAVFLAEDLTLERPVAIKVLPPEVSHDENLVGRFAREARTAAKLDHPNIIPIFAVESAGDLHYFVMKYVAGESLEQLLAKGALPIEQAQEWLWEAALALGHAHQRNVVHRDIKPGNIMLDHDGRVMLADFGISKAMRSATQYTSTGQVIGTPFYMSPEQAKGEEVDGRSDQYSLAVVGFQMITGQMPFPAASVHTIIYKHIFEEPPSIREMRPDCPAYVATAVHKALAKEPDDRFASMEDFAGAIMPHRRTPSGVGIGTSSEHASPEAATTITPTTGATYVSPRKEPKKRRVGVAAALVSALVVVGGGTGYWAWQEGYLEGLGFLPSRGALANADDSLTEEQPPAVVDSAALQAEAARIAQAQRDSIAGDSVAQELAAERQRADELSRQQTQPRETRPPPAPQTGLIVVGATPWGTVVIDGVEIGDTPLRHEVTLGQHIVRVVRDGCQTTVDTVTVNAGRETRVGKTLVCGG